jgi:hypothetical protein
MGHLYYSELGNMVYIDTSGNSQTGYGLTKTGDFTNLLPGWYWSGTESAENTFLAWYFGTHYGDQSRSGKDVASYALAVRPVQLESAAVPEPSTLLLVWPGWCFGGSVKGRGDPVGRPYGNYKQTKDLRGF